MSTRKGNSFSWGCGLKLANDCYLYIIIKIIIILAECCLIIKALYNCFYLSYSRHYLPNERTDWQQGYLVPDQSLLIILPHYQLSLTVIIKFWRRKKSWRERERERVIISLSLHFVTECQRVWLQQCKSPPSRRDCDIDSLKTDWMQTIHNNDRALLWLSEISRTRQMNW